MTRVQAIQPMARYDKQPRVLMHIGLPKTGTTSLQTLLFDRHPEIRHFGQSNVWTNPDAKTVLRALLLDEENNAKTAREHISHALTQKTSVVISDEALSFGEFMLRARTWPIDSTPETVAAHTKEILGEARILMVLRNQLDWLISWHRQGLKTGKYTETKFKRWLERDLGSAQRDRLFELLDYNRLVAAYADQFGAHNLDVRFYEDFRDDFPRLASEIAQTIDLNATEAHHLLANSPPANVTPPRFHGLPPELHRLARTAAGQMVLERFPRRYRTVLRELFVCNRAYENIEETTSQQIRAHFRAANSALRDRLGFERVPTCYA